MVALRCQGHERVTLEVYRPRSMSKVISFEMAKFFKNIFSKKRNNLSHAARQEAEAEQEPTHMVEADRMQVRINIPENVMTEEEAAMANNVDGYADVFADYDVDPSNVNITEVINK